MTTKLEGGGEGLCGRNFFFGFPYRGCDPGKRGVRAGELWRAHPARTRRLRQAGFAILHDISHILKAGPDEHKSVYGPVGTLVAIQWIPETCNWPLEPPGAENLT